MTQEYQNRIDAVIRAARHQYEVLESNPIMTTMTAGISTVVFDALVATQVAVKALTNFEKGKI